MSLRLRPTRTGTVGDSVRRIVSPLPLQNSSTSGVLLLQGMCGLTPEAAAHLKWQISEGAEEIRFSSRSLRHCPRQGEHSRADNTLRICRAMHKLEEVVEGLGFPLQARALPWPARHSLTTLARACLGVAKRSCWVLTSLE